MLEVDTEKIQISKLDVEIPDYFHILILKIDVQGYELEVLKGARESLKRTVIVTLEMNNHIGYLGSAKYFEIDEYLRNAGFILYDIFPSSKIEKQLAEWDSIYLNTKFK